MIILCCSFLIKVKIKVGLTKEGFTNIVSKFHSFTSLTGSLVPRPATKWCGPGNEANSLAQQSIYSHSPIQCLENNETVSNHVAGTSIHDIVLNRNRSHAPPPLAPSFLFLVASDILQCTKDRKTPISVQTTSAFEKWTV